MNSFSIQQTPHAFIALLENDNGSRYRLEACIALSTHYLTKRPQIVFELYDSMQQIHPERKIKLTNLERERVFQALMKELSKIGDVVIMKDNKWFELLKTKALYYLNPYTPRPKKGHHRTKGFEYALPTLRTTN